MTGPLFCLSFRANARNLSPSCNARASQTAPPPPNNPDKSAPASGNIDAADFRNRPAGITSEKLDDFEQKVFLVTVQRTKIFLLVPLHNYKAMRSSQDAGRWLHSNENTHLAAGHGLSGPYGPSTREANWGRPETSYTGVFLAP